ncbi:MAG: DUF930 domain-containing protein [Hyphomicrobiales bacterium]|nr:DUF930 domain-containing protein [Hyphomicrobiales bacterium]
MKDVDQRRGIGWALPASVTVHALAAALLIFGLPVSLFEAEPEKAIEVDLVPPPEPPKKAETAKAEPPPPAPKPEPPPPEAKAEKPPEPKPEPKPEAEKEAQRAAENVLQPVHRFGEKDGGPKIAPDGNSAAEASPQSEAEKPAPDTPEVAQPEQAEAKPAPEKVAPEQEDAAQPQALTAARSAELAPLPQEAIVPTPKPAPAKNKAAEAEQRKKLASRMDSGDVTATTAMRDLPRSVRGGRLCVTELREQMREASPPYFPDLLPSYPLEQGNVLQVPRAAFRLSGAWYELSFRCEVDTNATEVLAFVFRVGGPIPPSEWKSRGLPAR